MRFLLTLSLIFSLLSAVSMETAHALSIEEAHVVVKGDDRSDHHAQVVPECCDAVPGRVAASCGFEALLTDVAFISNGSSRTLRYRIAQARAPVNPVRHVLLAPPKV